MGVRIRAMIISALALALGAAGTCVLPASQASAVAYRLTVVNLCPVPMKGAVFTKNAGEGVLLRSGARADFSHGTPKISWKFESKRDANGRTHRSSGSVHLTPGNPSATRYLCVSW